MNIVAVDLGGTNIELALFQEDRPTRRLSRETRAFEGPERVVQRLAAFIGEIAEGVKIEAVGIGAPGLVDPVSGFVRIPPNFPGWEEVNLKGELEKILQVPVYLGNDANVYALGEWKFGAGKGKTDLVVLTLGTGVGGGIISGGRLLLGANAAGAEVGHISIDANGPLCNCGNRGCVEAYIGASYFVRRAEAAVRKRETILREMSPLSPRKIYEAALQGDEVARSLWEEFGYHLGVAVITYVHLFDPEAVILGGKIARAFEFFAPKLKETVFTRWMGFPGRKLEIKRAQLGDDAGIYGAYALAQAGGVI